MKSDTERKIYYNEKLHRRKSRLHVHLSKELRVSSKKRAVLIHTGDTIRIMRGPGKGKEAKVARVSILSRKVFLEGVVVTNARGKEAAIAIEPSNLLLIALESTPERKKIFGDEAFRKRELAKPKTVATVQSGETTKTNETTGNVPGTSTQHQTHKTGGVLNTNVPNQTQKTHGVSNQNTNNVPNANASARANVNTGGVPNARANVGTNAGAVSNANVRTNAGGAPDANARVDSGASARAGAGGAAAKEPQKTSGTQNTGARANVDASHAQARGRKQVWG